MDNAQVEVTQEDRKAGEVWRRDYGRKASYQDLLLFLARHRIAAIAAIGPSEYERGATEERAKIVAWLRDKIGPDLWAYQHLADAIETGEHRATAISNMEPVK